MLHHQLKKLLIGLILALTLSATSSADRPNIVIMLADDMGFGEVQSLNPQRGKIPTPRLDALAASGLVCTDAHSGSSVCTPTRYGLLTGRYAWRTRLQSGVLTGGESLIAPERLTLAGFLREQGYYTAIIGKWHLGMLLDGKHQPKDVPVGTRVTHGPIDSGGFHEFHGFHHARQIRLWVDDDRVTELIEPVDMLPRLTDSAVEFIHKQSDNDAPFFLYVPWSSPHSPVVPSPEWKGKSGLNEHADFVMQTDDSFGKVMDALKESGQLENTLVICSSDNGTSAPTSQMSSLVKLGHFPSGDLRGSKADIWDGGHRVPFIVSWPSHVEPGSRSSQLICLGDIMATVASVTEKPLPPGTAEDSFSFANLLGGPMPDVVRESVVHHSVSGYFALRSGKWKLCLCPGSGGWTQPKPTSKSWKAAESSGAPIVQLYDMSKDIGEQQNLAAQHPDIVARLRNELDTIVASGRSTPGPNLANDASIKIDKRPRQKK
ncbi:MAG: arylsulfatase [Aureliella sp.]